MEKWRRVWRDGIAPQLSQHALRALGSALLRDDPRLVQGTITAPPPLDANRGCDVVGACALGLCGWLGDGYASVGAVEDYFTRVAEAADAAFGEPAACRFFVNWFDDVPRTTMRRELLAEVTRALRERMPAAA